MEDKYIVALEIGSSHIRAGLASISVAGTVTLLAVEEEQAVDVVRYGIVQNVDEVSHRVKRLIQRIESNPALHPRKIKGVYVSIGGRSTASTARRVVRTFDDETEITSRIIEQIKEEAKVNGLTERTVVGVAPKAFAIDNMECHNPVGTLAKTISAEINLVTCRHKLLRNIDVTVVERQQLMIKDRVVRHIAMGDLVLTPDERQLGCMLVDFGAETTTVSLYSKGCLRYLVTLPLGSRHITRDIMTLHRITEVHAEELKRNVCHAMKSEPEMRGPLPTAFDGDLIEVNNAVRARVGEIVANIVEQVKFAGYSPATDIPGGIVIAGGGTKLSGFIDLLTDQSKAKVRQATIPSTVRVADPRIVPTDNVDIISLLCAVADNPQECTELPVVETPHDKDPFGDDDPDDDPGVKPIGGGKKPKPDGNGGSVGGGRSFGNLFGGLKRRIDDFLDNAENDEEDDE